MLKIGLTGGIGSGKTTVAKIFAVLGIPVYDADAAAKRLMQDDTAVKKEIIKEFGNSAYDSDGSINRKYLSTIVFNNYDKLLLLNKITHPATIIDAANWMKAQKKAPYVIKEAALLFESGAEKELDYVIGVTAPEDLRIARVVQRDKITDDDVRKRIAGQMNEVEKMKVCDYLIVNDENELVIPQILELDKIFREKVLA